MKTALGKGWKWLLGSLLTLLGFSGCERIGIIRCEYGVPNADFKLVGDVKDAKGKGIEGIRVVSLRKNSRNGRATPSIRMPKDIS